GERLGNEAVIGRIIRRRVKNAIELDQARALIQLVLDAGAKGNLNDTEKFLRNVFARGYVVPRVNHGSGADPVEAAGSGRFYPGWGKSQSHDWGGSPVDRGWRAKGWLDPGSLEWFGEQGNGECGDG